MNRARGPARPAWLAAAVSFAAALPVYLATMNRTIGFIDRGELAATACTLGISHPSGYPTLNLIGWLATRLIPARPVLVLNALGATLVAAGVGLLALLVDDLLARAAPALEPRRRAVLAALGALVTGATASWWEQANGFEAYSLLTPLLPLVLLLFLRWTDEVAGERPAARRAGPWFAFTLGLAFTAHMTTVLLAPALVFFAWSRLGGARALREGLRLTPAFLAGLLPFALLPLRSAMGPRFDWGGTHTLHGFLDQLTAREYRPWMFADLDTWAHQSRYIAWRVPWDLAWAGLLAAAAGLALLARRARALGLALALIVVVAALYAGGFAIRELNPYLLGCALGLGLLAAVGLLAVHERFGFAAAVAAGLALLALDVGLHARDCDESGNRMVENLTLGELRALPPRTLLFTRQWDYFLAASFYFQAVERVRPDVVVVSPDLLRRGWYLDELARRARPAGLALPTEVGAYRALVERLGRGESVDPATLAADYERMMAALVTSAMADRPVFCTAEAREALHGPWTTVPRGLALELRADTTYVADTASAPRFEPWPGHLDGFVATLHWIHGTALVARARYEAQHGRADLVRRDLALAASFDPHIDLARVPPLPYDGNALVAQSADFFARLERLVARGAAPAPGSIPGATRR